MKRLAVIFALGLAACSGQSGGTPSGPPRPFNLPTKPIPSALQPKIERSRILGRAIYEKDLVATRATDALFSAGVLPGDGRVRGWVVQRSGPEWVVSFAGESDSGLELLHEVRFDGFPPKAPRVRSASPPEPLAGESATMYRVLQAAEGHASKICDSPYNTVVLSARLINEPGWLVYFLAATDQPGVMIAGGHSRVHISDDGQEVFDATPLSRSCLISTGKTPSGTKLVGRFFTHIVTDWPLETHVFVSLLHNESFLVMTKSGSWRVSGNEITLVEIEK